MGAVLKVFTLGTAPELCIKKLLQTFVLSVFVSNTTNRIEKGLSEIIFQTSPFIVILLKLLVQVQKIHSEFFQMVLRFLLIGE